MAHWLRLWATDQTEFKAQCYQTAMLVSLGKIFNLQVLCFGVLIASDKSVSQTSKLKIFNYIKKKKFNSVYCLIDLKNVQKISV